MLSGVPASGTGHEENAGEISAVRNEAPDRSGGRTGGEGQEDRLWRLIASLTPAEKRAFRLQCRVHGGEEKAYVRLFDAIERQENPDPEGLRREFAGRMSDGSYHVLKNYLYRQILRILRHHSPEPPPETKVENLLQEVRILYEKGLHDDALVLLGRARTIAERWEMHLYLIQIASWHSILIGTTGDASCQLSSWEERTELLEGLRRHMELDHGVSLLSAELLSGPVPSTAPERERYDRIMRDLDLTEPPQGAFRRSLSYHFVRATYAYGTDDLEGALVEIDRIIELYRTDGRKPEDRPIDYLNLLTNRLLLLHHLGRTDELLVEFPKARAVVRGMVERQGLVGKRLQENAASRFWHREALFRIGRKEYDDVVRIAEEIEEAGIAEVRPESTRHWSNLSHLCSIGYFMSGRTREALAWNVRSIDVLPESFPTSRFAAEALAVLLHARLGNDRLVASLLRRLERYVPEGEEFSRSAAVLVELVRAIVGLRATTKSRNRLQRGVEALQSVLEEGRGVVILGHVPWRDIAATWPSPQQRRAPRTLQI